MDERLLMFEATQSSGRVSALFCRPAEARWLYVFGHGAGAGMNHPFMQTMADILARFGVATFRYQFPYMEAGKRAPSPKPILLGTIRSAVAAAAAAAPDLPILAGGKSMGGRMTSLAASTDPLPGVKGLVFLGFPLHAMGKPSSERGEHLKAVGLPMLFIQGTRDKLADLSLMAPLMDELQPLATMHIVDDGDHSLNVPMRAGRSHDEIMKEVAEAISDWSRFVHLGCPD